MTPFFPLPSLPLPLTLFPKTFHTKFSKNIYIPHYHVSCEPVVFPLHVWYRSKGLCAIGKWSFTVVTYIMRKIENFWRIVFCCWGVCLPQGLWECLSISGQVWPWVMRMKNQKVFYVFTTDLKISLFLDWVYKRSDKTLLWGFCNQKTNTQCVRVSGTLH